VGVDDADVFEVTDSSESFAASGAMVTQSFSFRFAFSGLGRSP
jgi:hypothetical protein